MLLEFPAISTFQDERSNWTLINLVLSLIGIVIFAFHFMPKFDAEKSGTKKNSAELRYMGVLVALGIVMLSLTQDFGGIMTFFDWWTIIHIFIFASIILCSCFHHQRQEERCDLNN
ncbi:MAG: hypothetical protein FWC20_04465 [Oscillospiraceae bacterium]|nr:hypothetical protein [Oscillospiraceae bacterium]